MQQFGLSTNSVSASDDFGKSGKEWQKDESWGTYKISTINQYSEPANLRNALGVDEKTSGKELFNILRDNKQENKDYEIIENVVIEFIQNLAIGISNLVNIFEPEMIGIGGSFIL